MKHLVLLLALFGTAHAQQCIDTDGDGWGWTGKESCRVDGAKPARTVSINTQCIDSDGDGWGWDGTNSCRIDSSKPAVQVTVASTDCVDSDGDGWGWNGTTSCEIEKPARSSTTVPGTNVPSANVPSANVQGITDVVVMMGQSNALGHNTLVNLDYDYSDERILAWTKNDGWRVADLCTQVWRGNWFPFQGGACGNHPTFQIAKGIVNRDPSRKVAIIPAGDAGKAISYWGQGGTSYMAVKRRIELALAQLPKGAKVNLVAWSQGESDHGDEYNWYNSVTDLIYRLRSEKWFDETSSKFIAQETAWSSVNDVVVWLNSDNDKLTGAVLAADQPLRDFAHFSGDALRVIGKRYAAKYLAMSNRR